MIIFVPTAERENVSASVPAFDGVRMSTKICTDSDICDATAAGIDLSMTVDEIFQL